jgi:hypothetical protein
VLTQSPTIQQSNQWIILVLTPSLLKKGTSLYLYNISQVYIQSTTLLNRDFYICLPLELLDILQLSNNTIIKVIKPLYSIPKASNYWFLIYYLYHTEKLKMKEFIYNPCLLYTYKAKVGIISLQTNNTLFIRDKEFV